MSLYAEIDKSRFPVVTVTFTGKSLSNDSFVEYLNELTALYAAKEKLAIIFDARNAPLPSLNQQQRQAAWLKENENVMREYCLGTAYVITKVAVRMILRMIFAITSQPVPFEVCSNMDDAEEWVMDQLSA
jgi:hypothetical protein